MLSEEPELESQDLYEHHRFTADKGQTLLRIDKFLMVKLANASRTRIQSACEQGAVLVNGIAVKSSYKVKPLDVISIVLPDPPRMTDVLPQEIPIDIIYEDDFLLLVNKAAGMVVHPAYANYDGTLVNALLWHFQHLPLNHGQEIRPGLVHRIDKDTSGLLLIAKTDDAMTYLAKQFFDHSISRKYMALVWGDLQADSGTVDAYIGRSPRDRKVMQLFEEESKGKKSITHWKVAERFGFATLISCHLETGRTHQIRATMQYLGHPIFGDETYGGTRILKGSSLPKFEAFATNCLKMIPRQALHAATLGFLHPETHQQVYFEVGLPEDFTSVLEKFRKYAVDYNI